MARRESDMAVTEAERQRQIEAGRAAMREDARFSGVVVNRENGDPDADADDREIRELLRLGKKGFNGGE